jgi:hypothetical protein
MPTSPMWLGDLLGRRVICRGEHGRVVEGHGGGRASVVVSIPATGGSPRHAVIVPESEWQELELLD